MAELFFKLEIIPNGKKWEPEDGLVCTVNRGYFATFLGYCDAPYFYVCMEYYKGVLLG